MNANRVALFTRQASSHLCILPGEGLPNITQFNDLTSFQVSICNIVLFRVELDQLYFFGGRFTRKPHALREDII